MSDQNWRTEVNAEDYFSHRQKAANVADRRPVIRKAEDVVGPGIDAQAVVITDFNDVLATYNGYFSAIAGTAGAPTSSEAFVGTTVMDSVLGGLQTFTGMSTGKRYHRLFNRNPSDPQTIYWGNWTDESLSGCPVGFEGTWPGTGAVPAGWVEELGQSVATTGTYAALFAILGYTYGGSGATFNLPDMRDRTAYGAGTDWSVGTTDGLAAGSRKRVLSHTHAITAVANHTHNISIEPAHSHTITAEPAHDHFISPASMSTASNTATTGGGDRLTTGSTHNHGGATITGGYHSHGGAVSYDGGHAHGSNTGSAGGHDHGGFTATPTTSATVTLPGVGKRWIIRYV